MTTKASITMKGVNDHEDTLHIIMPQDVDWLAASSLLSIGSVQFFTVYRNLIDIGYNKTKADQIDVAAQCLLVAASIVGESVSEVDFDINDPYVGPYWSPEVAKEILLRTTDVIAPSAVSVDDMITLGPLPAYSLR